VFPSLALGEAVLSVTPVHSLVAVEALGYVEVELVGPDGEKSDIKITSCNITHDNCIGINLLYKIN
jgi:hypothetical protein